MVGSAPGEKEKKKEEETWAESESKALLRFGLLSGKITADMKPKEVFDLMGNGVDQNTKTGPTTLLTYANPLRATESECRRTVLPMGMTVPS